MEEKDILLLKFKESNRNKYYYLCNLEASLINDNDYKTIQQLILKKYGLRLTDYQSKYLKFKVLKKALEKNPDIIQKSENKKTEQKIEQINKNITSEKESSLDRYNKIKKEKELQEKLLSEQTKTNNSPYKSSKFKTYEQIEEENKNK